MWIFLSLALALDDSCKSAVRDAECRVACQSRDYDGGYFNKLCVCFNRVALEKLIDHSIHLENTRLHPHDTPIVY